MATSYTSLLGLALPVTGELSGTWGDTVNNYITNYLDAAVAGVQIISGSQTAVTLSVTNGSSLVQVGAGATGSAQYGIIRCSGNPASLLTITAPAASKSYLIINATSTSQSVKIVGTGPTTGVTLVSGESAVVAWNGTDFIKVSSSAVDGVSTFSAGTTGFTPSTATSGAVTLAGTLATTNGGTGLTSFTANRVFYSSSTSAIGQSANLTFDGTTLTANALTTTSTVTINGGTANGVAYLNGSKVLTTGSALTFDGSKLLVGSNTAGYGTLNVARDTTTPYASLTVTDEANAANTVGIYLRQSGASAAGISTAGAPLAFYLGGAGTSEAMRLTSTGLGIGTSLPSSFSGYTTVSINNATNGAILNLLVNGTETARLQAYSGIFNVAAKGAATNLTFETNGSERMRLDSSGNLGLGVTPSAVGSIYYKSFELGKAGCGLFAATASLTSSELTYLAGNAVLTYSAGPLWSYGNNGNAATYGIEDGIHKWFTAPSGTAGNAITFVQAMTLDASGNLLVGTTSASIGASGRGVIEVNGTSDSVFASKVNGTLAAISGLASSTEVIFGAVTNVPVLFRTNNTERARITSGGFFKASDAGTYIGSTGAYHELVSSTGSATAAVYIRNTNATSPAGIDLSYSATSPNGTGNTFLYCQDSTALRMSIRSNGGIANYSANDVNLSDRREKINFAPAKSYLDTICAIPVQTFNYIDQSEDDPGLTLGVVAQDVQAVAPELVMESNWGTEDNPKMRLSVYQTDLQYALMKALQELKAEFDAYKATHP